MGFDLRKHTDWRPKRGDLVTVVSRGDHELGVLWGQGQNTVHYITKWGFDGLLEYLQNKRKVRPAVSWVQKKTWKWRSRKERWPNRISPVPLGHLDPELRDKVSDILNTLPPREQREDIFTKDEMTP